MPRIKVTHRKVVKPRTLQAVYNEKLRKADAIWKKGENYIRKHAPYEIRRSEKNHNRTEVHYMPTRKQQKKAQSYISRSMYMMNKDVRSAGQQGNIVPRAIKKSPSIKFRAKGK